MVCFCLQDFQTGFSRGYGFIQFITPEGHSSATLQDTHILDNSKVGAIYFECFIVYLLEVLFKYI